MKFPVNSLIREFEFPVSILTAKWSDGWRQALDAAFIRMKGESGPQKFEFPLYFSLLAGNLPRRAEFALDCAHQPANSCKLH
jgi:hypothetical protein